MDISILKSYEEVSLYIERVIQEADNNRNALGFLVPTAYRELAYKGQLWLAYSLEKNDIVGHLLFAGRYPSITVRQVLVYKNNKKSGIGSALVKELEVFGEKNNFISIKARVASDLSSNSFWEKNGFELNKQEKGGKHRDRIINIRIKELNAMTLFSGFDQVVTNDKKLHFIDKPILTAPVYAIDLNVFFDVTKKRRVDSAEVIRSGLNHKVKLCVTHEFINELQKTSDKLLINDPVLEFAKQLPVLHTINDEDLSSLKSELKDIIFPNLSSQCGTYENQMSDLIHLSACIHHKLKGFITREKAILENSKEIKSIYGVEIISPSDLEVDDNFQINNISVDMQDKIIQIMDMMERDRLEVEKFLIKQGVKEELLSQILNAGTVDYPRRRVVARSDNNIIGLTAWEPATKYKAVCDSYIYIDETDGSAVKIIDHVLAQICMDSNIGNLTRVNLYTSPTNSETIETAIGRGFRKIDREMHGVLTKVTYGGVLTADKWDDFKEGYKSLTGFNFTGRMPTYEEFVNTGVILSNGENKFAIKLFEFETMISPGIILCKNRNCAIVPIRKNYAEHLFTEIDRQKDMFPSKESLLFIEKSYFRKARFVDKFNKNMLMIFYVSGKNNGLKEAIGIARITFSGCVTPEDAELNFSRQGVLTVDELKEICDKNNNIHAIAFDNFSLFPKRLNFNTLKSMGCVSGANLVTTEFIKYDKLKNILKDAYKKGS